MTSKVKAYILAALTAIGITIAGLITYVQNTPVISDGAAGSVAPPAAGTIAPPVVDAGHPQPPVVDAGHPQPSGFANPAPGSKMTLGAQGWFLGGWASGNTFTAGVNWAATTSPWNPAFIAILKPYTTIRMMDWNCTNWSQISQWSQRRLPTDPGNATAAITDASDSPMTAGLAYEWQVDLANRAGKDLWIAIPARVNDDYVTQLATLVKARLRSDLRFYMEYSNENWNGQFSQFGYVNSQGAAQKLPGSNQYYQGISYALYRTLQMSQLVQNVFGASAMGSRVVRVFSVSGNMDLGRQAFASVYRSSTWNPNGQKVDMLATAPYITKGPALAGFKSDVDSQTAGEPIANIVSDAKTYGIPATGCYESGASYWTNASAFRTSSDSYTAYTYMWNAFAAKLNGPCNIYTVVGKWSSSNAWGSFDTVEQPLSAAHGARAAVDWAASH